MKFNKILLVMVLVAIGANIEVCAQVAQESAKDSTKNPLANDSALKEEKDNAAAQQQAAQDVTTHNEQEKSAEDKNKESRKKSHYDMLPDDEKKKVVDEALKEYKEKLDKNYYDLLPVEIQAEVRKKAQKEFVDNWKAENEKLRAENESLTKTNDENKALINNLKNTNEKLKNIKDKAIHDLETKIAEAKKLPISKLEEELNACIKEYESLGGKGDSEFQTARDQLDKLGEDLKLFNDVNSVLNSPYSVKSVNSALATIEVLKKNSVGCVERLGELDKKAALLKEYESLVGVFNRMVNTFKVIFESSRKNANRKQIKDAFENNRVQNFINEISKIPYLKAQFEKYYEELNANPMDSSLEDRYIQKK